MQPRCGRPQDDAAFESNAGSSSAWTAPLAPTGSPAETRRRTGDALIAELTPSPIGMWRAPHLERQSPEAAAAFDRTAPLSASVAAYRAASSEADVQTHRRRAALTNSFLSSTADRRRRSARPISQRPGSAPVETGMKRSGRRSGQSVRLTADAGFGGDCGVAAHESSEDNTAEFLDVYQLHQIGGFRSADAVEFALAGLMTGRRKSSRSLRPARCASVFRSRSLPVCCNRRRRRTGGLTRQLRELNSHVHDKRLQLARSRGLAMSLEPSQRWRRSLQPGRCAAGHLGSWLFTPTCGRLRRGAVLLLAVRAVIALPMQHNAAPGGQQHRRCRPVCSKLAHAGTSGQNDTGRGSIPVQHRVVRPFTSSTTTG